MSAADTSRWTSPLAALDANLLVALDALLSEANVTRAAARIGVTQSAMSQTLSRLRTQFDDPLLVRAGRRLELTAFAARLRPRLHDAIVELGALVVERGRFDPTTATRRFVIAATDYVAGVLVPSVYRALARSAPHIDIAVHAVEADSIDDRLARGAVDLYLGVIGDRERGLRSAPLFDDPLVVVVRRGHALAKRPLTEAAWAAHAHVLVSPRRDRSSLVDRALRERGLERRIAVEVPYFGMVPDLLERSDLVATIPSSVADAMIEHRALVALAPPLSLPAIAIGMAWHPAFDREPASRWLRALVLDAAGGPAR